MKKASSTVSQFEIRKVNNLNFEPVQIHSSSDSEKFCRQFYGDDIEIFESSFIALLNRANKTIGWAKISQGGVSGTVVDVKIIAKYAVDAMASAVILCHNHPSGSLTPSESDKQLTRKVKEGLKVLDITLLDHIILTPGSYTSFCDEGLL